MKKKIIISILTIVGLATVIAIVKVNRSNSKPPQIFKTENLKKQNIVNNEFYDRDLSVYVLEFMILD